MKKLLIMAMALSLAGCKMLSVQVASEDENINLWVPWSIAKMAVRFSSGNIEFDDLGGVDQEIDLKAIAKAFKEDGDRIEVKIKEGNTFIHGKKVANVFQINIDDRDEDTKVRLNLPMAIMDLIADAGDKGTIQPSDLMKGFRNYRGLLVEVNSPHEKIKIALR